MNKTGAVHGSPRLAQNVSYLTYSRFQSFKMNHILGSVIANVVGSVLSSFFDIPRNIAADKLKESGYDKLRDTIVGDLHDIKKKLDGLARKDLLSSYRSLKEGIGILNLTRSKDEQISKDEANADQASGAKQHK